MCADRHCEAEARDPAGIEKTVIAGLEPLDDLDAFVANMDEYAGLGIGKAWVVERIVPKPRDL